MGESISTGPNADGAAEPKSDNLQRRAVMTTASLPVVTNLRKPKGISGSCACDQACFHVSFMDMNSMTEAPGQVEVCYNAPNIYDQYLPRFLTGRDGPRRSFLDIKDGQELNDVLFRGTYFWAGFWNGSRAQKTVFECLETASESPKGLGLGVLLRKPCTSRGLRLIRNALTNVDGVLIPYYLSFQGSRTVNTWKHFDRMASTLVRGFIHDTANHDPNAVTYYERVKKTRNLIKDFGFKEELPLMEKDIPDDLWFFREVVRATAGPMNPTAVKRLALITQTRCIGLPPPQMRVAAYRKFVAVATSIPEPLAEHELDETVRAVRSIFERIAPDREALIKVMLRAQLEEKISLSSSAELDVPQNEGGKLEAARRLILAAVPQQIYNLETGLPTVEFITRERLDAGTSTPGEVVFMNSFEKFTNGIERKRLYTVRAIAVAGPGKYRVATASALEHAALLHPLAHTMKVFVSELESTRSGMTAGNHLWEFYARIKGSDVQVASTEDVPIEREQWFSSEDWEAASDSLKRETSALTLLTLGRRLGLPTAYLDLCAKVLTHPRIVALPKGLPEDIPKILVSTSGVLMGDPVTKIILQLSHNVCRLVAWERLQTFTRQSTYLRDFAPETETGPTSLWEVDRSGSFEVENPLNVDPQRPSVQYKRTLLRRRAPVQRERAGAVRVRERFFKTRSARIERFESLLRETPTALPPQAARGAALREFFGIWKRVVD